MSPARIAAKTSAGSSSSGGIRRVGVTGVHGRHLQVGPVQLGELAQAGEVQHPADLVAVRVGQAEAAQQQEPRVRRHRSLDLEADRLAEPAAAELLLDGHQQVVRLVLLDREVGVAGHAEEVVLLDLHAAEQEVEVRLDHLVDQHEAAGLDLEQPRQDLRDLHAGEPALPGRRVAQPDRDREREGRDVGERVARVDRERGQDREDLVDEALAQGVVVLRDRRVVDHLDALDGQLPPHVRVDRRQLVDEGEDPFAGRVELLLRRSVRRASGPRCRPAPAGAARRSAPGRTHRGCRRRSPGT